MGAIGYTSGDPSKVNRTGDTMTGDLILSGAGTDLTVGGVLTDTFQGVTGDLARFMTTSLSTGITSGGSISINANPALVDIAPCTGWIFDYNPTGILSATNPQLTQVNYPGQTGVTPLFPQTFFLINSAGVLVQQASFPSVTQFRTHLSLGTCGVSGGIVQGFQNLPFLQGQTGVQTVDLMRALGAFPIRNQASRVSANGANVMINITAGALFARAFGLPNYQDPHTGPLSAQSPANFHRVTGTAVLPALVNTIDVANYDPGGLGVVTPIGGGVNNSTIHRVFATSTPSANNQLLVHYGQTIYSTLANAVAAIPAGTFVANPATAGGCLIAYVVATRVATNLSDVTQASITQAAPFAVA